jgi:hypothetical protein
MITRRGIITGLISLAAAPAVVRASSLMRCSPTENLVRVSDLVDVRINFYNELALENMRRQIAAAYQIPYDIMFGAQRALTALEVEESNKYFSAVNQTILLGMLKK